MEIIVTHDSADFDALAAAVAATKLYPEANVILGRRLGQEVREFLALHGDRFPYDRSPGLDVHAVTKMVVVDVRRASRLQDYAVVLERARQGLVEVHVYDHHPSAADDIPGAVVVVEPVGCATTLLLERIQAAGIAIDAVEATLFALGIHADTGSLTHPSTSDRDALALAWLLGQGANLAQIGRYLRPRFTGEHRRVLNQVLGAQVRHDCAGLTICSAEVSLEASLDGLGNVVDFAAALANDAAWIVVFRLPRARAQVIARGRSARLDLGAALATVGGGGHAAAAAATLKHCDDPTLIPRLLAVLASQVTSPICVADLMSSPVRTVAHDTPLATIAASLTAWNHTGVVVLRAGKVAGILSRRDIAAARERGHLDLPATSCMSQHLQTTREDVTLEQALAHMESANVGRLPVLRAGQLVGIITRSDILRALYRPLAVDPRT